MNIKKIKTSWKKIINLESKKDYYISLKKFIDNEYEHNVVFPKYDNIYKCFNFFNFNDTKLVILGQDPYYTKDMADGLAFSTNSNICPKSLNNLFKEIENDFQIKRTKLNLDDIASQGVLLLNTCLTVLENKPLSHSNKGWEEFTNNIIKKINDELKNVIFLLMGNNAISKSKIIDENKHIIIKTSHPSPLSYNKSLRNSKTFFNINKLLLSMKKSPIIW